MPIIDTEVPLHNLTIRPLKCCIKHTRTVEPRAATSALMAYSDDNSFLMAYPYVQIVLAQLISTMAGRRRKPNKTKQKSLLMSGDPTRLPLCGLVLQSSHLTFFHPPQCKAIANQTESAHGGRWL